jgi:endonuclease VIII
MPEGDTLFRIASRLRPALEGRAIVAALSHSFPNLAAIDAESLVGNVLERVEARGKHLLLTFDDQRVIHSHLGMNGSWHLYPIGEPWRKPPHLAGVALRTETHEAVNFNPKLLRLTTTAAIHRDPYLRRLGPDMMLEESDLAEVIARMLVYHASPIGEAVMNQTIACGIGNIYKSETLFLAKINPWTTVGELSHAELHRYLADARQLMRLNRHNGQRTTRFAGDGKRMWVYGRAGQPCFVCGTRVGVRRQGDAGRTTYWCAACQLPKEGSDEGTQIPSSFTP